MMLYIDPIANFLGKWSINISTGAIILRLVLAFVIGAVLGIDRSLKRHPAGLRTCMLVCIAGAICMLINAHTQTADGVRLAAGIVTGIGFLGAGTIVVTKRNRIKGLTTAAIILMAAVLGIASGAGYYLIAILGLVLSMITIIMLPIIERIVQKRSKIFEIHVELISKESLTGVMDWLREKGVRLIDITLEPSFEGTGLGVYTIVIMFEKYNKNYSALSDELQSLECVRYVEMM